MAKENKAKRRRLSPEELSSFCEQIALMLDSGMTLSYLKKMLADRGAASIKIVTLLDKPARREVPMEPEYTGFVIEDEFVIGYGLDYDEEYRNLPYVGVLKRSVYEQ